MKRTLIGVVASAAIGAATLLAPAAHAQPNYCSYDFPSPPPYKQCVWYSNGSTPGQWCDLVPIYFEGTTVYNMGSCAYYFHFTKPTPGW